MVRLTSDHLLDTTRRLFLGGSRSEANNQEERFDTVFNGARYGSVRTTLNPYGLTKLGSRSFATHDV